MFGNRSEKSGQAGHRNAEKSHWEDVEEERRRQEKERKERELQRQEQRRLEEHLLRYAEALREQATWRKTHNLPQ